jgi:hypothetical protein
MLGSILGQVKSKTIKLFFFPRNNTMHEGEKKDYVYKSKGNVLTKYNKVTDRETGK